MTALRAALAVAFVLAAAPRKAAPREGLPECMGGRTAQPVVITHLGGCLQRPARLLKLDGIGDAGGGWSVAQVSRADLSRLRRSGCPTAVACSGGNEYAALVRALSPDALARRLDTLKPHARPTLRPGIDGGPLLHAD